VSFLTGELMPKRLEILHELVPGVGTIAMPSRMLKLRQDRNGGLVVSDLRFGSGRRR
jgi:hypothetical protein